MTKLVLASASPRRQALLRQIGAEDFQVRVSDVDETYSPLLSPAQIVETLSRRKAEAVPCGPEEIVIAADTMVFLDSQRLGKPKDPEDALRMLKTLRGRTHTVRTGITVRKGGRSLTEHEATEVLFRSDLTDGDLQTYVDTGEPLDKAGAYGIQARGALLVERIDGDIFNVIGLPLLRLYRMLQFFEVNLLTELWAARYSQRS